MTDCGKEIYTSVHGLVAGGIKGTVISKEKVMDDVQTYFSFCLKSMQIEEVPIHAVSEIKT